MDKPCPGNNLKAEKQEYLLKGMESPQKTRARVSRRREPSCVQTDLNRISIMNNHCGSSLWLWQLCPISTRTNSRPCCHEACCFSVALALVTPVVNGARATETAQRLGELSALAKNLSQAAHHYCMESRGSNTLLHLCGQLHACAHIPTQTDTHINYLFIFFN